MDFLFDDEVCCDNAEVFAFLDTENSSIDIASFPVDDFCHYLDSLPESVPTCVSTSCHAENTSRTSCDSEAVSGQLTYSKVTSCDGHTFVSVVSEEASTVSVSPPSSANTPMLAFLLSLDSASAANSPVCSTFSSEFALSSKFADSATNIEHKLTTDLNYLNIFGQDFRVMRSEYYLLLKQLRRIEMEQFELEKNNSLLGQENIRLRANINRYNSSVISTDCAPPTSSPVIGALLSTELSISSKFAGSAKNIEDKLTGDLNHLRIFGQDFRVMHREYYLLVKQLRHLEIEQLKQRKNNSFLAQENTRLKATINRL